MRNFIISILFLFVWICTSCTPTGERNFRFQREKDYKLIYMTCSSVAENLRNPTGPRRNVYMVVFESEELDINGRTFKPRTYYIDRKDLLLKEENRLPETNVSIDKIQWVTIPKMRLDGLAEDAKVIITSNNKVIWDTYDNTCRRAGF